MATLAFFTLATEMKARYGFPTVVLRLPLVAIGARYAAAAALLRASFLLNALLIQPLEGVHLLGLEHALNALVLDGTTPGGREPGHVGLADA